MAQDKMLVIDPKSGLCSSNSIFYSKRDPLRLPANESLDITTFISSYPHHGHIAYIDAHTGQHLTFSEVWRAVDSVSTSLYNLGIRKGHVVLILSPNSVFFPIVCHSVMSLGAIITTTNPMNTPNELRLQIIDSNPVLAFTTQPLLSKLETATDQIPIILITDHDHGKGVNNKRVVSTLHEMMAKKPNDIRVKERVNQDDTACLLYSSGTTGNSKGVASSHKNLIVLVQNFLTGENVLPGKQTIIATVPMFHIYGFGCFVIGWLASEFTVVVLSRFDLDAMLSSVSRYRVTHLPVAPPVINTMINKADEIKSRWDLSSLRTVVSGGASLSKEGVEGFLGHYPTVQLLQGYAMTESNGFGASMDTVDESKRFGSVGRLSASLEAKIIDPVTGDAFGVNRTGELWIRGPSIMKGYLNNSEATAATIDANGWLKTGDLCYIDEDGFLYVVDRLKELIKYKGYQVPPAELESLLLTHPQIADAAVIPYPDVEAGQVPMAYIVRQNDADLQESTIKEFVAEQVAPYKRIRHVKFITAIPKNPSGKILRKDLIKLATSKL